MALSSVDLSHLAKLKAALQDEKDARKFERLAAALVGRLLGVGVAVAATGFQHGGFNAASTELTAWALLFFAPGLSAISMIKIAVPAFYALEDTRTPMKLERAPASTLNEVWDEFLLHDAISNLYWGRLYVDFPDHQFRFVEDSEVVAEGNCVPVSPCRIDVPALRHDDVRHEERGCQREPARCSQGAY